MFIVLPDVLKYLGFILVFVGVLLSFGVSTTEGPDRWSLRRLIIGLVLQPLMENFFAGILIISTGSSRSETT